MATLTCKHCGTAIPAESIGDGELAICNTCDALNNLSTEPIVMPQKAKAKRNRFAPDRFKMQQFPDAVEISYHWWQRYHWGLIGINLIWNGFMALWITIALSTGEYQMLLCGSIHILVGLGLFYALITGAVNRTRIRIEEHGLNIIHRPIPTYGNPDKRIDRRSIEQVYCQRRLSHEQNEKPVYVFDVHYVAKGAADAVLVKGLETHEEALFVEQYIESLYHLDDEAVGGEWYKNRSDAADEVPYGEDDLLQKRKK